MAQKNPKILFFTEALDGGIFSYLVDLSNNLANKYKIYLAYCTKEFTPQDLSCYFDSRIHLIEFNYMKRTNKISHYFVAIKQMKILANHVKPDIIHLHSSFVGVLGRLAFIRKNIPLFYTPHGYSFLMTNTGVGKRHVYYFIEKILAKTSCTIISCGPSEQAQSLRLTKRAIEIDNGINTSRFDHLINTASEISCNNNFDVYTVGRITAQKNPSLFNQIAEDLPELNFLWIGDGEDRKLLTAPNITVSGWLDKDEMVNQLINTPVFMLTSDWEGLPLSLLEAMYMKKVCLVHNIPGNRDVIEDEKNGYLCSDKNSFISRLNQVQESNNWEITSQSHQDIIDNYSMKKVAEKYSLVYQNAIRA